jgi:hypothetical protein
MDYDAALADLHHIVKEHNNERSPVARVSRRKPGIDPGSSRAGTD